MQLVLFVITISIASLFQGIIGFGFALIATPIALLFMEKEAVVCSILIVSLILNGMLTRTIRQPVNFRRVIPLLGASLVGLPIGIWILTTVPINFMRVLVGILVIVFTVILYFTKPKLPKNNFLSIFAGFLSGILNTSTGMSGPPVVLVLTGQNLPKNKFRKTLVTFFFLMAIVSLILLYFSHVLTFERIRYGLISIPFVYFSGLLGNRIAGKVPKKIFMMLALGTVFLAGLYGIFTGLQQ